VIAYIPYGLQLFCYPTDGQPSDTYFRMLNCRPTGSTKVQFIETSLGQSGPEWLRVSILTNIKLSLTDHYKINLFIDITNYRPLSRLKRKRKIKIMRSTQKHSVFKQNSLNSFWNFFELALGLFKIKTAYMINIGYNIVLLYECLPIVLIHTIWFDACITNSLIGCHLWSGLDKMKMVFSCFSILEKLSLHYLINITQFDNL
jgi:hypothetical protein